jgi:hypothetical protein
MRVIRHQEQADRELFERNRASFNVKHQKIMTASKKPAMPPRPAEKQR